MGLLLSLLLSVVFILGLGIFSKDIPFYWMLAFLLLGLCWSMYTAIQLSSLVS